MVERTAVGTGGLRMVSAGARLVGSMLPVPGVNPAWSELSNKLAAYRRFRSGESLLASAGSLPVAVRAAFALGPRRAPWVLEGLGFAHAEAARRGGGPGPPLDAGLPRESLLPLHTGIGLSLARSALDGLGGNPGEDRLRAAVERFSGLCRAHARPGYEGVALEAFGLVARVLHPHLMARLDRVAADAEASGTVGPGLGERLWHGAGRGLYFAPAQVVPVLDPVGRALRAAGSEPPHAAGRANAVAGVAWAITLVNLYQPEVLERVVGTLDESRVDATAFRDGVVGALLLHFDVVGRDAGLEALLRPRPGREPARWEDLVRRPAEEAVARRYPELRHRGGLGELFRFHGAAETAFPRRNET